MNEPETTNDEGPRPASPGGDVGDVESAGETTAAVAITSTADPKPVGADTLVKVADAPASAEAEGE